MTEIAPVPAPRGGWQSLSAKARRVLLCLASPTWALADELKRRRDEDGRTALIVFLNQTYLGISAVAALLTWAFEQDPPAEGYPWWIHVGRAIWFAFLWSRCTEVFAAFYRDAFDKLEWVPSKSGLSPSRRVRLALNSYAELVLNFALLYWLLPASVWSCKDAPSSFGDILFYSASTITTSGGGGFTPAQWPLRVLTAYEIACGLILLVVCFAIYAGKALGRPPAAAPPSAIVTPPAGPNDGTVPGTPPRT